MIKELLEINDDRLVVEMSSTLKENLRRYANKNNVTMAVAVRLMLYEAMSMDLLKKQVYSKESKAS